MGCSNSKTKEKRRKSRSTEAAAAERAAQLLDTSSPANKSAHLVAAAEAPPLVEQQSAGEEIDEVVERSSATSARSTSTERQYGAAAADSILDPPTRAPLDATEVPSARKSVAGEPAETDDVSESPTQAPHSARSLSSESPPSQKSRQGEESAGSHIHFEIENNDAEEAEEAAEGDTEVELSLPRSPTPSVSRNRPAPTPASTSAVEKVPYHAESKSPVAMERIPLPTERVASSSSSRSPNVAKYQHEGTVVSSRASSFLTCLQPKEKRPGPPAYTPCGHSFTTSIASSFSAAEKPSQRSSERCLSHPSGYSGGSPPAFQHHASPALAAPPREYGVSMDDNRAATAAVVAVEVSRPIADQFFCQHPAGTSAPHTQHELHPAFHQWCRGVVSPVPLRQEYTGPTPDAGPGKLLFSTKYMPPPTAYRVVTPNGAPWRLSFNPSIFAAIEASSVKLIQAHALS